MFTEREIRGKSRVMLNAYETDHRDYLKKEWQQRVRRRPLYSQRAFARDLGLSPSSLVEYYKGSLKLSTGRISQIAKKIGLEDEQRQHWIDLVDEKFSRSAEIKSLAGIRVRTRLQAQNHSMSLDEFKIISEWFHFAFLELIEMDARKYSDLKKAATALGIPLRALKIAVKRLLELGFLKLSKDKIFSVDPSTVIPGQVPSEAIRQYHGQILKKAQNSIEKHEIETRVNTSTMVALPREILPRLRNELHSSALKILEPYLREAAGKSKNELYCLTLHFFSLLEGKGRKS